MDLREQVLEALRSVQDPDLHKDIVSLGMVRDLSVDGPGRATFTVCLTTPACPMKERIKSDCESAVMAVAGITAVTVNMTATVNAARNDPGRQAIPGVKNIIAVGSGKGGVGKSTTSVNIAVALAALGAKTAILDADIYGPNVPGMVGATGRPKVIDNRIIPMMASGVSVMSMGFLLDEDTPLIFRGPMLHGVLKQLLFDTNWGQQDYLVIDLPPGTGDVQLSLSQMVPLSGAVIITTPQNVALQDAKKGIAMFQKVNIPILGIVENMSYYLCPKCGHRDEIFSHDGGANAAKKYGVPFLGRVPLNTDIREGMDTGRPIALREGSEFANVYREIAQKVAQQVSIINSSGTDTGNKFDITPT